MMRDVPRICVMIGICCVAALIASAVGLSGYPCFAEAGLDKPNIIVILADDLGYADVGFHGCRDIPTPNLDRLAAEGVRCTNGYVSHPFCSPTRAGMITGRYQQRFGHENNPRYDTRDNVAGLPTSQHTVAEVLTAAGYVTGAVGKWHLGAAPQFHPNRRGFQEYFGLIGGGHDYWRCNPPGETREYLIPLQRNQSEECFDEYLTDVLTKEAVRFIERHQKERFFLYLAYNAPHTPLQATDERMSRVAAIEDPVRRSYGAMICALDDGVGKVWETLHDLGLTENTLVFFLSDNGGPTKVTHSSNAPLRGEKGSVYEGGIRVPFVVTWKGKLPSGATYDKPIIGLDVPATAAALADATFPPAPGIDGVNVMPHLLGEDAAPPHDALFWRTGGGNSWAVRRGEWKLVKFDRNPEELYRLDTDIGESRSVAEAHPEKVKELRTLYETWNRDNIPPLFESPRPAKKPAPRSTASLK